ncbi:MAG: 23S rRNA pseudouridine(2604) synthase RluF [Clostridiales bacterium]|nr:23S rRNA pseudouridine(2604) synthase RluF [Clostridiales bacterium]
MAKVSKRMFDSEEKRDQAVRINKFLSDSGVCSRREADSFVEQGKVLIDGEVAVMGSKVLPGQKVVFCGKPVEREDKMILIALNKPQGIVCTTDKRDPDNIIDFLNYGKRIYPIGRLDKDSEGLILLTNNGDIVNKILRAGNNHEKEYIVTVNKVLTSEFLKGMSAGVPILDTVTRPCTIEAINKTTFRIILTQGLNRQIRRMCEYFGYRVLNLQRVRIMNVNLGRLHVGGYRNLTDRELEELKELIEDSANHPISTEIDEEMVDVRVSDKNINYKNTHTAAYKKHQYKGKNFAQAEKDEKSFAGKGKKPGKASYGKENHKASYGKESSKNSYGRNSKQGTTRDQKSGYSRAHKSGSIKGSRSSFGKGR